MLVREQPASKRGRPSQGGEPVARFQGVRQPVELHTGRGGVPPRWFARDRPGCLASGCASGKVAYDSADHPISYSPMTDRRAASTEKTTGSDMAREARDVEDRFFAISIDMLCHLDFNGYFSRLSQAWERTLGFTREELMSRPFIEFVHSEDRERTLEQNARVRAGGFALAFENRYMCKDGSYRWFRWNAAPDVVHGVVYSVARDVTAEKQAAEERERLMRELQAALAEVRSLQAILPICSYCNKVRDDENYWQTVEAYISRHTSTRFSHGICPECMAEHALPALEEFKKTR